MAMIVGHCSTCWVLLTAFIPIEVILAVFIFTIVSAFLAKTHNGPGPVMMAAFLAIGFIIIVWLIFILGINDELLESIEHLHFLLVYLIFNDILQKH